MHINIDILKCRFTLKIIKKKDSKRLRMTEKKYFLIINTLKTFAA